jgi:hypothetical protein
MPVDAPLRRPSARSTPTTSRPTSHRHRRLERRRFLARPASWTRRDGRFLYPAFPYTSYTQLSREDSDALFAYLRTLPRESGQPFTQLRFPYDQRPLLGLWRALYFSRCSTNRSGAPPNGIAVPTWCAAPAIAAPATAPATWWRQRGAAGPGRRHDPGAGLVCPAPGGEHGLGSWSEADIAALLRTGVSPRGTSLGPMSEIVGRSLQYLDDEDINAAWRST